MLAALPALVAAFNVPSVVGLATQILIYAIAAMSLNLVLGYGGMVTFGHAAFFGLGGYTVGILYQHFADNSAFLGLIAGYRLAGGGGRCRNAGQCDRRRRDRKPVAAHQRGAVHHDHAGVRADGVLPVRLAEGRMVAMTV